MSALFHLRLNSLCLAVFFTVSWLCPQGLQAWSPRPGKTIVEIGGQSRILTKGTSCKPSNWKWNPGSAHLDSCRCCLIKSALNGQDSFNLKGNHVGYCLEKGQCTPRSLKMLRDYSVFLASANDQGQSLRGNSLDNKKLVEDVIEQCLVSKSLEQPRLAETPLLRQEPPKRLTPDLILDILERHYPIARPRYSVQELGAGGAATDQLYGVFENVGGKEHMRYVVKGYKKYSEIQNLKEIDNSFLKNYSIQDARRDKDFPALVMDVKNFKYKDKKGHVHYIGCMIAAPGTPLFKMIKSFDNPDVSEEKRPPVKTLQQVFFRLGYQLGRLHSSAMTQDPQGRLSGYSHAVHGDLHTNNIFFDQAQNSSTLIDIETMAFALRKPLHVAQDLRRLYIYPTLSPLKAHYALTHINEQNWHNLFFSAFLEGYVTAYVYVDSVLQPARLEAVMKILRDSYLRPFSTRQDLSSILFRANPYRYYKRQEQYLRPLINELEQRFATQKDSFYAGTETPGKGPRPLSETADPR